MEGDEESASISDAKDCETSTTHLDAHVISSPRTGAGQTSQMEHLTLEHATLETMDRWQELGADNNARWCDLVVRSHGGQSVFADDAWTSPTRTPPLFPDAVTLIPSPRAPDLLSRIDTRPGCTIKDSFACLDLSAHGFRVLFDAQWIVSPASPGTAWDVPSDWTQITDLDGLSLWEEAWCHDNEPKGLFLPELFSEGTVVLGRFKNDKVVAGGIVSRSAHVAGLSNVFTRIGQATDTWSALARGARTCFPNLPLMGYERGEELIHAQRAGFDSAGSLRVWISSI
jgi:hypothetical protein